MRSLVSLTFMVSTFLVIVMPFAEAQKVNNITDAVSKLPTCAATCILSAIKDSPCGLTNTTCICSDSQFETTTESCVTSTCNAKDALNTKGVFMATCGNPVRDRSPTYALLTWVVLGLSTSVVAARLAYKLFSSAEIGLDDLFTFLAYLAVVPSFVINLAGLIPAGLGKDIWTLTASQIRDFGFWFYVVEPLYFVQMGLVKMALLCFYMRIFDRTVIGKILWGTVAFNAINTFVFTIASIFQCTPISYYWTKWSGESQGSCIDINGLAWAYAIIGIALDIWMLYLSLSMIRTLHLHWGKKLAVALMFFVGALVTIISILRLQSLVRFAKSMNPTWDQYDIAFWTSIEVPIGIICCCMPTIRLILIKAFPTFCRKLDRHYSLDKHIDPSNKVNQNPARSLTLRGAAPNSLTTKLLPVLQDTKSMTATQPLSLKTYDFLSSQGTKDLETGSVKDCNSPTSHSSSAVSYHEGSGQRYPEAIKSNSCQDT
ncbi:uncharacterized protein LY79DRAFT_186128 [Colletotrichum navitas]|uniref:CFEM domain-containing protein n=1 Tax=Colletotrichum navitas TaxID=681940 RepID=A0AAD8V6I6_9PEZI|nr:uncharacterized protein LY79DRAFT_186128 [Colletotrichum navitas]KAK1593375.1 hypothetical protein LY79DRAFT_186128 [Colletotrichum navitas]